MRTFPIHTALAILTTGLLMAGVHAIAPAYPAPRASQFTAMVDLPKEHTPLAPLVRRPVAEPVVEPRARIAPPALFLDANGSMDQFYAALWRTEKKERGAITRIEHYGDSPTTADLITGDVRAILQKQYGDAGHGFILVSAPWAWYQHAGVDLSASNWKSAPASSFGAGDGLYGLGGVSFLGGSNAHSRVRIKGLGPSRAEIWFLKQPEGGTFTVAADGMALGRVETAADARSAGFAGFDIEAGARELQLQVESGTVRMFGVTIEKAGPGVVYDSLGMNGASISVLSRMFNEKHWAAELQHRKPSLVIVNYGTNEADFGKFIDGPYEKELKEAIRRIRSAAPAASILVMSPMDRGQRGESKEIETMPTIPRIVAIQKRVAAETGCGFFDTFTAMGGAGTMGRWYTAQPRLVSADFIHPYPAGGKIIAGVFSKEIFAGLSRYKLRQVEGRVH